MALMIDLATRRPSICFEHWRFSIQTAMDLDQLMLVVGAYMSSWSREELLMLPLSLASPIGGSEQLMDRAVDASRAEVQYQGEAEKYPYLRQMALTLAFAASRLRYLQALRASGAS
jgi:hypothetical protein